MNWSLSEELKGRCRVVSRGTVGHAFFNSYHATLRLQTKPVVFCDCERFVSTNPVVFYRWSANQA